MTGWRLGWIVLDDLVQTAERLAQNLYISAPTLNQIGAIAALIADELDAHIPRYQEIEIFFTRAFKDIPAIRPL